MKRNIKQSPAFKVGQQKGKLTVSEYIGWIRGNRNRAKHTYRVTCDCGQVETMNQDQMHARNACKACAIKMKKSKYYGQRTDAFISGAKLWPVPRAV